jgi:hypothetical protein
LLYDYNGEYCAYDTRGFEWMMIYFVCSYFFALPDLSWASLRLYKNLDHHYKLLYKINEIRIYPQGDLKHILKL